MTYRAAVYFPSLPEDRIIGESQESAVAAVEDGLALLGILRPFSFQAKRTMEGTIIGYDGLPAGLVADLEVRH